MFNPVEVMAVEVEVRAIKVEVMTIGVEVRAIEVEVMAINIAGGGKILPMGGGRLRLFSH